MASQRSLTIGEVAERVGLAMSALCFHERQGLITAGRTDGGQRRRPRAVTSEDQSVSDAVVWAIS